MQSSTYHTEILAPVGDWEMCQAAVHNGAHAIYIGMPNYNARGRTQDFSVAELRHMIDFCHLHGVKVFLACNVLIFEKELSDIEQQLREILPLGPDAFIVQDIGLVRLIKRLSPHTAVHASTQMTITNVEAIELLNDLGIQRFVLGREVSIPEMSRIRERSSVELEVFVHGALCVAYSGQCLTSESQGGRSANRGQCAQSCRMPYELVVDGQRKELGDKRYLVSPQDLCGINDLDRLIQLGINSFKIEGRLKSPEYVASAVRNYREVSDRLLAGLPHDNANARTRELSLTFARGSFNGWLDGVNHQRLVDARISRPHGSCIGEVLGLNEGLVEILSAATLEVGDGVVFQDFKAQQEVGGTVFRIGPGSKRGELRLKLGDDVDVRLVRKGMLVYHNSSSSLGKSLRKSYQDKQKHKKIPLTALLKGSPGHPLELQLTDRDGNCVEARTNSDLLPARSAPLSEGFLRAEIGALGGTPFELQDLRILLNEPTFIHHREIKALRREAVKLLELKRLTPSVPLELSPHAAMQAWQIENYKRPPSSETPRTNLHVLLREDAQVEALRGLEIDSVYLDFEFNKSYDQALAKVREFGLRGVIATTRIMKPGELGHLKYIERLKPDAILVRNLGALKYFENSQIPLIGDFSLNVCNGLSAQYLLAKGLCRLTASYDLNQEQLLDLFSAFPGDAFEVTVHQYMPAFHMEHCVFAAFLSNGSSYRDCGRPCEKHRVELRDQHGILHPLKPDAECRNTMFSGKPQSAARLVPKLQSLGVQHFRLEALFETAQELRTKAAAYVALVRGTESFDEVRSRLGAVERYGVSEGQLLNTREYQDRKKPSLAVIP